MSRTVIPVSQYARIRISKKAVVTFWEHEHCSSSTTVAVCRALPESLRGPTILPRVGICSLGRRSGGAPHSNARSSDGAPERIRAHKNTAVATDQQVTPRASKSDAEPLRRRDEAGGSAPSAGSGAPKRAPHAAQDNHVPLVALERVVSKIRANKRIYWDENRDEQTKEATKERRDAPHLGTHRRCSL